MDGLACMKLRNAPKLVPTHDYGQIAEGNDFHRRAENDNRADQHIARAAQRELNITEWRRRIAEAVDNGDHETANNIRVHLEAGHD